MSTFVYFITAPTDGSAYTSLERLRVDPSKVRGYATCAEAVRVEACGDPFVPGYFIGEDPVERMAALSPRELGIALKKIEGLEEHLEISWHYSPDYGEDFSFWAKHGNFWFERLGAGQLAKLLALFPKRHDSRVVGRRRVLRIEVS